MPGNQAAMIAGTCSKAQGERQRPAAEEDEHDGLAGGDDLLQQFLLPAGQALSDEREEASPVIEPASSPSARIDHVGFVRGGHRGGDVGVGAVERCRRRVRAADAARRCARPVLLCSEATSCSAAQARPRAEHARRNRRRADRSARCSCTFGGQRQQRRATRGTGAFFSSTSERSAAVRASVTYSGRSIASASCDSSTYG
jgi:hypothetical protein